MTPRMMPQLMPRSVAQPGLRWVPRLRARLGLHRRMRPSPAVSGRGRLGGRVLAATSAVFGTAWVTWRITTTLSGGALGASWWLCALALAVDIGGLFAGTALMWGVWVDPDDPISQQLPGRSARTRRHDDVRTELDDAATGSVDVLICTSGATVDALRATVQASRHIGRCFVVGTVGGMVGGTVGGTVGGESASRAALAAELGVDWIETGSHDDPVAAAAQRSTAPLLLILDAGDVPVPDIVEQLRSRMTRADIAVVQGCRSTGPLVAASDRAGAVAWALNGSLGARSVGIFSGSGALIRREAVLVQEGDVAGAAPVAPAEVRPVPAEFLWVESIDARWAPHPVAPAWYRMQTTIRLFNAGWQIVAGPSTPVAVASLALDPLAPAPAPTLAPAPDPLTPDPLNPGPVLPDLAAAEYDHAATASAARLAVTAAYRIRRGRPLTVRQRLALCAWAAPALSGIRRCLLIAVVIGSLLSGAWPYGRSIGALVGLWLPWVVLSSLALRSLTGGAVRCGDRSRLAMRLIGPSWRGVLLPTGRVDDRASLLATVFGLRHSVSTAVAVVSISIVLGLRGISDQLTHTLHPLPVGHSAVVVALALWTLVVGLDALNVLVAPSGGGRRSPHHAAEPVMSAHDQADDGARVGVRFAVAVAVTGALSSVFAPATQIAQAAPAARVGVAGGSGRAVLSSVAERLPASGPPVMTWAVAITSVVLAVTMLAVPLLMALAAGITVGRRRVAACPARWRRRAKT